MNIAVQSSCVFIFGGRLESHSRGIGGVESVHALWHVSTPQATFITEEERRTRASRVKNSTVKVDANSDVDETVMGESRAPLKEPNREQ
uniref:Uncharacterized protein n=1 Tax=Angiostrongylus cantonensis TaxID=6313 RepID=A0A0K0DGK4_ANGCA